MCELFINYIMGELPHSPLFINYISNYMSSYMSNYMSNYMSSYMSNKARGLWGSAYSPTTSWGNSPIAPLKQS